MKFKKIYGLNAWTAFQGMEQPKNIPYFIPSEITWYIVEADDEYDPLHNREPEESYYVLRRMENFNGKYTYMFDFNQNKFWFKTLKDAKDAINRFVEKMEDKE